MSRWSATSGPHKGQSPLGHHFLCFYKSLSTNQAPRDQRRRIDCQRATLGPAPSAPNFHLPTILLCGYFLQRNQAWNLPSRSWAPSLLQNCKSKFTSVPRIANLRPQFGVSLSLEKEQMAALAVMAAFTSRRFGEGRWLPSLGSISSFHLRLVASPIQVSWYQQTQREMARKNRSSRVLTEE